MQFFLHIHFQTCYFQKEIVKLMINGASSPTDRVQYPVFTKFLHFHLIFIWHMQDFKRHVRDMKTTKVALAKNFPELEKTISVKEYL